LRKQVKFYFAPVIGEAKKQIRSSRMSFQFIFCSTLWPLLALINTYIIYFSFDISQLERFEIFSKKDLLLFIATGALCFNCFWVVTSNSYQIVYEKMDGTIELIFQTPVNRLLLLIGRALGSFMEFTITFILYMIIILLNSNILFIKKILFAIVIYMIVAIGSVIWGVFTTSLFFISRDSGYLFSIFNSPMELLSGSNIPLRAFPKLLYFISGVFPLTYTLEIVRSLIGIRDGHMYADFFILLVQFVLLLIFTSKILSFSEKKFKVLGSYNMY
jgi:ABC-2 type transport system permease protein